MRTIISLTLAGLLLASTAVVALHHAQDARRVTSCVNNLSQLWKMEHNYMVQYGGSSKSMPLETGDAFWLKLATVTPPLIDKSLMDIFQCPVENVDDEGCDYRGPSSNVNTFADGDAVGADVDGNHGEGKGGNVLRRSGDVQTCKADDALWKSAAKTTTGGNAAVPPKERVESAKQKQALVDMGQIAIAVMLYYEFTGDRPATLKDLVEKPKEAEFWPEGGYLKGGAVPKDPWGRDYLYEPGSDRTPGIKCLGADGKKGGSGDDADLDIMDVFQGRGEAAARRKEVANRPGVIWASMALKTIVTAEADFRSNDRDNNRTLDFWTGDVRSLHTMCGSEDGTKPCAKPTDEKMMKLIEASVADADAAPLDLEYNAKKAPKTPTPYHGYLFRAMEKDQDGKPYQKESDNVLQKCRSWGTFGFCAYPAEYKKGTKTLIVNESNTIWSKDTGGKPVLEFPAAPGQDGWTKLD